MTVAFDLGEMLKSVSESDTGRERIEYICLDLLESDEKNFYAISEVPALADNIATVGLQQPLRVRKHPSAEGRYMIVSGHRRRAALELLAKDEPERWSEVACMDLAIKDGIELDKKTVASIIGVPGFLLGVGSFNKEEYNTFISRKILPICRGIEQELTKKLIFSDERYWRFNSRGLYAYSLTDLASVAKEWRGAGLMTGNEARNWIDMAPKDGLDELVMLENYLPTDRLGDQKKLNDKKEDPADV